MLLPTLLSIAATFWGGPPACGTPVAFVGPLDADTAGLAQPAGCYFTVNRDVWRDRGWYDGDRELCAVVVHEYGHLVLGDAFTENPSDPAHSLDPRNIMYAKAGPSIPACDRWARDRSNRWAHQRGRRKVRT